MEDARDILQNEQPFGYQLIKNDKVQITFKNRLITTLHGKEYYRFQRILESNNPFKLQLYLAKVTGQFKHGNEKL